MASSVQELESLLREYYSNPTVDRRAQIDAHLNSIRVNPQSWSYIQPILSAATSDYVRFFALTILECNFAGRWSAIPIDGRLHLRNFLTQYLVENFATLSPFVLQRLVRGIVSIAAHDWPKRWAEFFASVQGLCQNPATCALGILIVKLTSEEFNSPRTDVKSKRKTKIRLLLTQQAANIIGHILVPALQTALTEMQSPATAENGTRLGVAALEAMHHFYSWMPLNEILHPQQLETLFVFVNRADKLSLVAFDCLNEIMSRNYVPAQHMNFIGQILSLVFQFLQQITAAGPNSGIDPQFTGKFTEFTSLFVKNHMTRRLPFQLGEFLALLLKFTAFQTDMEQFLSCLDIWDDFVDFMNIQADTSLVNLPHEAEFSPQQFGPALIDLADHLVDRVMFSTNLEILESLGTEAYDKHEDDGEQVQSSELLQFQSQCFNLISGIVNLFPAETIARIGPKLVANLSKIAQIQSPSGAGNTFHLTQDICSSLRIFGTALMHLVDKFAPLFDVACEIFQSLIKFAQHCGETKIYTVGSLACKIHADALNALKTSTHWLCAFYTNASDSAREMLPKFESFLQAIIGVTTPIFHDHIPDVVAFAAARLLRSLCETIHHPGVLQTIISRSGASDAFGMLNPVLDRYSLPVQEEAVTLVILALLIPSAGTPPAQQDWAGRENQLASVMNQISAPVLALSATPFPEAVGRQDAVAILHRASSIFTTALRGVKQRHLLKQSMEIFSRLLMPTFGASLSLLSPAGGNHTLLERLVSFHLEALETFSSSMDSSSLELVVQQYLALLQGNSHLDSIFSGQDKTRVILATALMHMLEAIVKLPFSPLVGNLINFVIEQISPAIKKSPSPTGLFEFYYQAITQHVAVVLHNPSVAGSIYSDFLWALEQQDIETYRTVLVRLEDLARRRSLFSAPVFLAQFYNPFIGTIFRLLLLRTHHLLWEQMTDVLFAIIRTKLAHFYSDVLPALFHSPIFGQITQEQQASLLKEFGTPQDLLSIRRSVESIIDDYSYYMRTNNPIPNA